MKLSYMGRLVALMTTLVFVFAGCGGQATSTSSAIPQGARTIQSSPHKMSSSSGDLIYATGGCGGTCVISYPEGKVVGSLSVGRGGGTCVDGSGDIFITNNSTVVEYAHGGTTPIETLNLPGNNAYACSVDPKTGNLAVVLHGTAGDVAIFPEAQGTPTTYVSQLESNNCGYDNAGNLFVDGNAGQGFGLSELLSGASNFSKLSVNQEVGEPGRLQWHGHYLTWQSLRPPPYVAVSRLSISGSQATIVSVTHFKGIRTANPSWIYDKHIIIPFAGPGGNGETSNIGIWRYPQGGKAADKFQDIAGTDRLQSVTLSPGNLENTNH